MDVSKIKLPGTQTIYNIKDGPLTERVEVLEQSGGGGDNSTLCIVGDKFILSNAETIVSMVIQLGSKITPIPISGSDVANYLEINSKSPDISTDHMIILA